MQAESFRSILNDLQKLRSRLHGRVIKMMKILMFQKLSEMIAGGAPEHLLCSRTSKMISETSRSFKIDPKMKINETSKFHQKLNFLTLLCFIIYQFSHADACLVGVWELLMWCEALLSGFRKCRFGRVGPYWIRLGSNVLENC